MAVRETRGTDNIGLHKEPQIKLILKQSLSGLPRNVRDVRRTTEEDCKGTSG